MSLNSLSVIIFTESVALIIKKNAYLKNKKPELLAPAGDMEAVIAAINAGADAIYFGGIDFNARHNAKNLSRDEMTLISKLSQEYAIKNYIVLNTLIKDSEWQGLIENLNFYQTLKIDGLIVQDLGLIYLLQKYYPEFRLQTSTQMSVYGLEGVLFFEELGFTRLVCPREMSLEEVSLIKKASSMQLKVFVHGALCYAYSGQCLLSSMIGGRSGNRGRCAQPCRQKYDLFDGNDKLMADGYLLSPKDLNTLDDLEAIVNSGVDALKIEGRMKTPEYVFAVTRAYRDRIDDIFGQDQKASSINDRALMQVFNRNFTKGHLLKDSQIMNPQLGKNRGIKIGKVGKFDKKKNKSGYFKLPLILDDDLIINIGDGLSFGEDGKSGCRVDRIFSKDGKLLESSNGQSEILIPYKGFINSGQVVFRNLDINLMEWLRKEALKPLLLPKQELNISLRIHKDQAVEVDLFNAQKRMSFKGTVYPEKAEKNPLNKEMIEGQFRRLGDSDFELKELKISCQPGLFLSKSQLNGLRKDSLRAFEQFGQAPAVDIDLKSELNGSRQHLGFSHQQRLSIEFENVPLDASLEQIFKKLKWAQARVLIEWVVPLKLDGEDDSVFENLKKWRQWGICVKLLLPKIMTASMVRQLKYLRDSEKLKDSDGLVISNYEALYCLKDGDISLEANASFNVFNTLSLKALKQWGFDSAVLSLELQKEEIDQLGMVMPLTLPVYGYQEVMVSKKCILNCPDCPEKNKAAVGDCKRVFTAYLEDDQQKFPIRRDKMGLTHIYSAAPLFLKAGVFDFKAVETLRIYHHHETINELNRIIQYFLKKYVNQEQRDQLIEGNWGRFKRGVK